MTKHLLEAKGLRKIYRQGAHLIEVLKGVDLVVDEGERVVITGASGSGKSTLLHLLSGLDTPSGLIPDAEAVRMTREMEHMNPSESREVYRRFGGEIFFDGNSMLKMRDRRLAAVRNRFFGFVFQFYHLVPELTALENVMLPGWIRADESKRSVQAAAERLLDQVGLEDRLTHLPSELSGGEQQRVAIARALINRPRVLFCDEPTGTLDAATGEKILRLLMRVHEEQGTALVIVTHDQSVARAGEKVLILKDGKLWV